MSQTTSHTPAATTTTTPSPAAAAGLARYSGGCHCGKVRFEVEIDLGAGTGKCNCSICTKTARWGAIVKPSAFTLRSGEECLSDYQFNSKSVHHLFCSHCGIHAFGRGHIEQIGGDFVSINLNCLDGVDLEGVAVRHFDGRNDNW